LNSLNIMVRPRKERTGPLADFIDGYIDQGYTQAQLTVLTDDPFQSGTDEEHTVGQWMGDMMAQLVPATTRRIPLRGLHYRIVAKADIRKPDGMVYENTNEDWAWLMAAAKPARVLGYVPFDRIVDERNEPPFVHEPEPPLTSASLWAIKPELSDIDPVNLEPPYFETIDTSTRPQPYRIILFGEKSSLDDVLLPLARRYRAELILPNGEPTDTLVYDMAQRAANDGRPAVVLYFSDFDPSGFQMPISVSRTLQLFRHQRFHDLNIRVYRVALTFDHVNEYDLPSTTMKKGERRATKWMDVWGGKEQTEIDALAALQPDILTDIAEDAILKFYDSTLAERVADAQREWLDEANARLREHPEYANVTQAVGKAEAEANEIIERANAEPAELRDRLEAELDDKLDDVEPPEVVIPEAEVDESEQPEPWFDSTEDFLTATQRLKDFKSYDRRTLGRRPKRARFTD
jgi:hypothetical protein